MGTLLKLPDRGCPLWLLPAAALHTDIVLVFTLGLVEVAGLLSSIDSIHSFDSILID